MKVAALGLENPGGRRSFWGAWPMLRHTDWRRWTGKVRAGAGILAATLALAAPTTLRAQGQAAPGAAPRAVKPWTADDVVLAESAGDFRISPDGRGAVWVKATADKDKDARVSNLVLSSLTGPATVTLTRGADENVSPRWSPSGARIAFLSSRPRRVPEAEKNAKAASTQVWLIDPTGGEPWPVTELTRAVRALEWIDDDTILFSAEEDPALDEQAREEKKDATRVVDDEAHSPPVRLFKLAVGEKKVTRLTANADWIGTWALSPDGRRVVARHDRSLRFEWDQAVPPRYFLHDLATGEAREVFADGAVRPEVFRWARDSSGFFAVSQRTSHPRFTLASVRRVHFCGLAAGAAAEVPLDWDRGLSPADLEVTPDGFVASLANGVRPQLARYTRTASGWSRAPLLGDPGGNILRFVVSTDGRTIVYERSTASTPTQWARASLDGARLGPPAAITALNPFLGERTIARTEVIRWPGANGVEIEGLLYYPHGYEAGKRYPLLTAPHGGPFGADYDAWDEGWGYANNLLAQRGAFVLRPNYQGSSDYGLAFAESICCGKYYELPVKDIEAGVDHLIAKGLVDPDRIGSFGWSNGSILSIALLIANPGRYKAAAVGAGDVEWSSDWANVDFGHAFDSYYFGASPLENPQLYVELSPFYKMDRVQTPTLIFFGTEDRNVPTSQGWSHFRALQHLGKVPVKFVLFPGEPHGLRKLTHQLRKLNEETAWFERYLFKTEVAANEALKPDSPLGEALRRHAAKRVGPLYGEVPGGRAAAPGLIVPETVDRTLAGRAVRVGRFEVTRAQFAAFDPAYRYEPATGNHPANGVTFERAKAYLEWLGGITGRRWRLPNADEAAALYGRRDGENTLDYWAGYAPNPDDAARLAEKVAELGGPASLLKEVGSFKGVADGAQSPIFDLGGNVAEWSMASDGTGIAVGGSADQPADAKAASLGPGGKPAASRAAPSCVGFRAITDAAPAR